MCTNVTMPPPGRHIRRNQNRCRWNTRCRNSLQSRRSNSLKKRCSNHRYQPTYNRFQKKRHPVMRSSQQERRNIIPPHQLNNHYILKFIRNHGPMWQAIIHEFMWRIGTPTGMRSDSPEFAEHIRAYQTKYQNYQKTPNHPPANLKIDGYVDTDYNHGLFVKVLNGSLPDLRTLTENQIQNPETRQGTVNKNTATMQQWNTQKETLPQPNYTSISTPDYADPTPAPISPRPNSSYSPSPYSYAKPVQPTKPSRSTPPKPQYSPPWAHTYPTNPQPAPTTYTQPAPRNTTTYQPPQRFTQPPVPKQNTNTSPRPPLQQQANMWMFGLGTNRMEHEQKITIPNTTPDKAHIQNTPNPSPSQPQQKLDHNQRENYQNYCDKIGHCRDCKQVDDLISYIQMHSNQVTKQDLGKLLQMMETRRQEIMQEAREKAKNEDIRNKNGLIKIFNRERDKDPEFREKAKKYPQYIPQPQNVSFIDHDDGSYSLVYDLDFIIVPEKMLFIKWIREKAISKTVAKVPSGFSKYPHLNGNASRKRGSSVVKIQIRNAHPSKSIYAQMK